MNQSYVTTDQLVQITHCDPAPSGRGAPARLITAYNRKPSVSPLIWAGRRMVLFLKAPSQENAMQVRLISHPMAQLARLAGLVKHVRPVRFGAGREWGVLVEGRGFARLLEREHLDAPGLHRPASWAAPHPMSFRSRWAAANYARTVGLVNAARRWPLAEGS